MKNYVKANFSLKSEVVQLLDELEEKLERKRSNIVNIAIREFYTKMMSDKNKMY